MEECGENLLPEYRRNMPERMACIVAHPDDEVMWAGGLLQHGDWTVICCSIPKSDPIRAYKFFRCCEILGVHGRLLPFVEGESLNPTIEDLQEFDGVLTHNAEGEYGHLHHKEIHRWVVDNFNGPVYTFGFGKGEYEYQLTKPELIRRIAALQSYDHLRNYRGTHVMKWEALLTEYDPDFSRDTYDEFHKT